MQVTVSCPCGQPYQFDIEPVNGQMPCPVNCPTCGADGTTLANQVLAESFAAAPAEAPAQPEVQPSGGRLRINRPAAPAPPAFTPAPAAQEEEPAAAPGKPWLQRRPDATAPPASTENIPMGLLGGIIAGTLSALVWYGLTISSGSEFGIVAWGVGIVTGLGVRILGRDGSALLGAIAAVCAAAAILGGQFMVVNSVVNRVINKQAHAKYLSELERAKKVVNAKTDQEIKDYISNRDSKDPNAITAGDIKKFREQNAVKAQAFLDGTPSQQAYETEIKEPMMTFSFKWKIFEKVMSLFTVLWILFGVLSAFKIAGGMSSSGD